MATQNATSAQQPVLVLRKIRQILECFSTENPTLTLVEIRQRSGLPQSTCQRLVQNLVREGFLDRDGGDYRIGLQIVRWSVASTQGRDLVRVVDPVLVELRERTNESAGLFVRDGPFRTLIALREARHQLVQRLAVGMVMPLHAGTGRVFLAYDDAALDDALEHGLRRLTANTVTNLKTLEHQLEQTRREGYVVSHEERDTGISSISAPVFGPRSELLAVLAVAGPVMRLGAQETAIVQAVVDAGREASGRLGFRAAGAGEVSEVR